MSVSHNTLTTSISAGFAYKLQQQRGTVLASHTLPSVSVQFTYKL